MTFVENLILSAALWYMLLSQSERFALGPHLQFIKININAPLYSTEKEPERPKPKFSEEKDKLSRHLLLFSMCQSPEKPLCLG